jgi:hypothetical protein
MPDFNILPEKSTYDEVLENENAPVVTRPLPVIFHICQESRAVALSEYIPFSYSYLHPLKDTLFISQNTACHLEAFVENEDYHAAHFYPLQAVKRLVLEYAGYDELEFFFMMEYVGPLIQRFGIPKEIVFAAHFAHTNKGSRLFEGFDFIDLTPLDSSSGWAVDGDAKNAVSGFMGGFQFLSSNPDEWGLCTLTSDAFAAIASVARLKHGAIIPSPFTRLDERGRRTLFAQGRLLSREWKREKVNMEGRPWDNVRDGDWNGRWNVERLFREMGLKCPWNMLE